MSKVYLVTNLDEVLAIYDEQHKADADDFAVLIDGAVEERELNPLVPDPGSDYYKIIMLEDGSTNRIVKSPCRLCSDGSVQIHRWLVFSSKKISPSRLIYWGGYADSEQHAIQLANELRLRILAGDVLPDVVRVRN